MVPAVVLAGGVILSCSPAPDSYLQKPCAQPSWLKEGLGTGAADTHNVHFLLSPVGWGVVKTLWPLPVHCSREMLILMRLEPPHTSGFLAVRMTRS